MQSNFSKYINKLMRALRSGLGLLIVALLCSQIAISQEVKIIPRLESDSIRLGDTVRITYDLVNPANRPGTLFIVEDSIPETVDFTQTSLKNTYRVQAFDTGYIMLPPAMFVSENDTNLSVNPVVFVISPEVEELIKNNSINDSEGAVNMDSGWYDFLPDFITDAIAKYWYWILIGFVIIAGGVCAYLIYSKRLKIPFLAKKEELPYDAAIRQLRELKNQQLWEKGQDKEYYTRLTEILRSYIDGRFGISAMEMTSSQLLDTLEEDANLHTFVDELKPLLELSDFVKFAKNRPSADLNVDSFNRTYRFIEETKPINDEEEPSDNSELNSSSPLSENN